MMSRRTLFLLLLLIVFPMLPAPPAFAQTVVIVEPPRWNFEISGKEPGRSTDKYQLNFSIGGGGPVGIVSVDREPASPVWVSVPNAPRLPTDPPASVIACGIDEPRLVEVTITRPDGQTKTDTMVRSERVMDKAGRYLTTCAEYNSTFQFGMPLGIYRIQTDEIHGGLAAQWEIAYSTTPYLGILYSGTEKGTIAGYLLMGFAPNTQLGLSFYSQGTFYAARSLTTDARGAAAFTYKLARSANLPQDIFPVIDGYLFSTHELNVFALLTIGYALVPGTDCPGAPPSRLAAGMTAMVTPGDPNNLRDQPGGKIQGKAAGGSRIEVLDGPVCKNGYAWFNVKNESGQTGWTSEGNSKEYWIIPEFPEIRKE